jgi:lysophospholipid acyltransferase (LPLAT)-like uncharacterized protein
LDPLGKRVLGALIAFGVRLLTATVRCKVEGRGAVDALVAGGERLIYSFWHGRQAVMLKMHEGDSVVIMVSLSADGTLQKKVVEHYGYTTVRGSSSRRGVAALLELKRLLLEDNRNIGGLAVDGPRGPREEAKDGAATLAAKTGAYLIPISAAMKHRWMLESWDRLQIPWPFTSAWMVYGEPVAVVNTVEGKRAGIEALQRQLDAATIRAEELVGR